MKYYTLDLVNGSGRKPVRYNTYKEAYEALCCEYIREKRLGYKTTLYKIMQHTESRYNGQLNIMIQPVWNP